MTLAFTPRVLSPHPATAQKTLQTALALGDLLDIYRPNLERRFLLDLLDHCRLTDDDIAELADGLLKDADGVPETHQHAQTLRTQLFNVLQQSTTPLAA